VVCCIDGICTEKSCLFIPPGHVVNLETFGDSHLAAVLIKKYLRDLPEPIFPESLYPVIRRCPPPSGEPGDVASVIYIREVLLPQLPHCAYVLLSYIMRAYTSLCSHLLPEADLLNTQNFCTKFLCMPI
jgi:Rho GTPase-activating protein 1